MKPLHHTLVRLSRCPCCHSPYTIHNMKKQNDGKSAARNKDKQLIKKELKEI
jgi:hypothetical protein